MSDQEPPVKRTRCDSYLFTYPQVTENDGSATESVNSGQGYETGREKICL